MSGLGSVSCPLLCIVDVKTEMSVYGSECTENEYSTGRFLSLCFFDRRQLFECFIAFLVFFIVCPKVSCWKPSVYTCQSECGLQSSVAMLSARSNEMDYFQTVTYTNNTHTHGCLVLRLCQFSLWCLVQKHNYKRATGSTGQSTHT